MSWRVFGVTALLVLAGLGTWWFLQNFERGTLEIDTGYLGEARRNDYHAAARLLAELGARVRTVSEVRELRELPDGGVIVLPGRRATLTPAIHARLREWVEAGGHLLVIIWLLHDAEDPDWLAADPLLSPLGVRQYMDPDAGDDQCPEPAATDGEDGDPSRDAAAAPRCVPVLSPTRVEIGDRSLQVDFDARYDVSDAHGLPASWRVASHYGTHVLGYDLGDGRLSVLTDMEFLRNGEIGRLDHAEFSVRLLDLQRFDGPVWVVYAEEHPPLLALLVEAAWAPLAALGLLLALAVWRGAARFGPLIPAPARARRELREHLDASGRHAWRWARGRFLLASVRAATERDAARRDPAWSRLSREVRLERLAARAGLEPEHAASALEHTPESATEFVDAVATLQTIRKAR